MKTSIGGNPHRKPVGKIAKNAFGGDDSDFAVANTKKNFITVLLASALLRLRVTDLIDLNLCFELDKGPRLPS